MATYKVIQDIEAEDKLVGPLSLRQFIYAGICALSLYLAFLVASKGLPIGSVIFIPPAVLFGFLAFPWKGDQPTEVWALAKIRFYLKPRKRIWNQSGVRELVTITAPKKIEPIRTNGLSQTEVRSRLKALADTIDSRGWVIKNVPTNTYGQPIFGTEDLTSDRLINVASLAQPNPISDVQAADDMLDVNNNKVARQFDTMIAASTKAHRQQVIERMQQAGSPQPTAPSPQSPPQIPNNYWFLNQPGQASMSAPVDTVTFNTQVVTPGTTPAALPVAAAAPTPEEEAFIRQHAYDPVLSPNTGHLHVIQPLSNQQQGAQAAPHAQPSPLTANLTPAPQPNTNTAQPPVTQPPDTAILDLARNDDLNVATIAREAHKRKELSDEVVISLH